MSMWGKHGPAVHTPQKGWMNDWQGRCTSLSCMTVVVWPWTLASLQCRDGARRVFTDHADIVCIKREAPWGVRRIEWRVSYILLRTACEADFGTFMRIFFAYWWQHRNNVFVFRCGHFQCDNFQKQQRLHHLTVSWVPCRIRSTHYVVRSFPLCGKVLHPAQMIQLDRHVCSTYARGCWGVNRLVAWVAMK